jgi:nitroimidazol reductase NimA-like FMN-containing flavoprotein (pyridoxamine 5'-phosphate oxidase superfamily)
MIVREMSNEECFRVLANSRLARLACASNNQPYVVPVYLAYHESPSGEPCLYGYSTVGKKVEWMRANPQVCVEVDDVENCISWRSVIVFGRYVELPAPAEPTVGHPPERAARHHYEVVFEEAERHLCYQLLQTQALWWEPASTARVALDNRDSAASFVPILYKISIDRVTGHEAKAETCGTESSSDSKNSVGRLARLRRSLKKVWRTGSAVATQTTTSATINPPYRRQQSLTTQP